MGTGIIGKETIDINVKSKEMVILYWVYEKKKVS